MRPIVELKNVSKSFGSVLALKNIDFAVQARRGALPSGRQRRGQVDPDQGARRRASGQRRLLPDRRRAGYDPHPSRGSGSGHRHRLPGPGPGALAQHHPKFLSRARAETGWGIFSRFDVARADEIVVGELARIGIDVPTDSDRRDALGRRAAVLAIARAVYFGARVLILDEPTSALGVHQASIVLKYVAQARKRGLG